MINETLYTIRLVRDKRAPLSRDRLKRFINAVHLDLVVLLKLQGENLQRGVQLADYSVTIGSEQCVVEDLTSNVLHCQPPFDERPLIGSADHYCERMQLNSVLVILS